MDCFRSNDEMPQIQLSLGKMYGQPVQTRMGADYLAFTRIPYAKAPIGSLRFRKPVPVDPWPTMLDATRTRPSAVTRNGSVKGQMVGTEDCLYLDVFTPDLPVTENQERLPVIVWIPGNLEVVENNLHFPEFFMNSHQDVVFVALTYRKGPFGFLSLDTEEAPGNQGLWDQRLALHFIRDHIGSFGGDPDCVTLMGHGFGSLCVGLHVMSPQSAGLFHRAVCMSGSFLAPGAISDRVELGRDFGTRIGCVKTPKDSSHDILRRMNSKSTREIFRGWSFLRVVDNPDSPDPWMPIVDIFAAEPFLPEHPVKIIEKGAFNMMPMIIGGVKDEGIYFASRFVKKPTNIKQLDEEWDSLSRTLLFNRSRATVADSQALAKVKEFYMRELSELGDDPSIPDVIEMFGDAQVFGPNTYMTGLILPHMAQPIYTYSFEYLGDIRFGDLVTKSKIKVLAKSFFNKFGIKLFTDSYGVCHGDDLRYLFSSKKHEISLQDARVTRNLVSALVNFAKVGNPTPATDTSELSWPQHDGKSNCYMVIAPTMMIRHYNEDQSRRILFWKKILSATNNNIKEDDK